MYVCMSGSPGTHSTAAGCKPPAGSRWLVTPVDGMITDHDYYVCMYLRMGSRVGEGILGPWPYVRGTNERCAPTPREARFGGRWGGALPQQGGTFRFVATHSLD